MVSGKAAEGATRSNTEARGAGLGGVKKGSAAEGACNNYKHGQDNFQPHQEDNNTKDGIGDQMTGDQMTGDQMIVAGPAAITSRARTTPRSTRKRTTPKTGSATSTGTNTRTSGDDEQGQDNFQPHQEEDNTKDGIGDQMTCDQRTGNQMITAGPAAITSRARTTSSPTRKTISTRTGSATR